MKHALLALIPAFALAACGGEPASSPATTGSEGGSSTATPPTEPSGGSDTSPVATQATNETATPDAVLTALGDEYVGADLTNGARQYRRCQSCHTLSAGGRHTVGPNLHGVIGRAAASADGFSYSSQLSEAGLTWDPETLDAWIENPRALVAGNRMSFVGLRDAEDRRDVIAYIAVETAE